MYCVLEGTGNSIEAVKIVVHPIFNGGWLNFCFVLVRLPGFEPGLSGWEPDVLPS